MSFILMIEYEITRVNKFVIRTTKSTEKRNSLIDLIFIDESMHKINWI